MTEQQQQQTPPASGSQQDPPASGSQQGTPAGEQTPAPKSLEDMLADLSDEQRDAVLGQVTKARTEAKNLRARLRETEPLAQQAKAAADAQKTAEQRAQEAQAESEKRANGFRDRAVKAEVKALAAKGFADPDDASAFLDLSTYVDNAGDIDTKAIEADLADLLKRKPHLGAPTTDQGRRQPAPDRSQGSSGNGQRANDPGDVFASFIKSQG